MKKSSIVATFIVCAGISGCAAPNSGSPGSASSENKTTSSSIKPYDSLIILTNKSEFPQIACLAILRIGVDCGPMDLARNIVESSDFRYGNNHNLKFRVFLVGDTVYNQVLQFGKVAGGSWSKEIGNTGKMFNAMNHDIYRNFRAILADPNAKESIDSVSRQPWYIVSSIKGLSEAGANQILKEKFEGKLFRWNIPLFEMEANTLRLNPDRKFMATYIDGDGSNLGDQFSIVLETNNKELIKQRVGTKAPMSGIITSVQKKNGIGLTFFAIDSGTTPAKRTEFIY